MSPGVVDKRSTVLAPDHGAAGVVLLLPLERVSVDRCVPALAPGQQPEAGVIVAVLAALNRAGPVIPLSIEKT